MRSVYTFLFFAATGLACNALAEPAAAPQSAAPDAATATVSVVGSTPAYRMLPGRLDQTVGAWHLDNGSTLRISQEHRKLIGEIGQARAELIPVADNVFFSRDDNLTVVLGLGSLGEEGYVTYNPEQSALVPPDALRRIAALR